MIAKHLHRMCLVGVLICTLLQSSNGQESLLNTMVYGSDKDSILLSDYVEGYSDYMILIQPENCEDCKDFYIQYHQAVEQWKAQYNLQVILIAPQLSSLASIESQVESYELEAGLDVLLTKTNLSSNQRTLLVNGKLTEVVTLPKYLTVEEIKSEVQSLKESAVNPLILDNQIIQCLEDLKACGDTTQLLYTGDERDENGQIYTKVHAYGNTYSLRETQDGRQVYLYHHGDNQEYLLLDYTGRHCDTLSLYSVMTDTLQTHRVSKYTCVNGIESWVLELPFDCDQESRTLTLIYGQGTNAGLIPLYDESAVYTALLCQYDDSVLTQGEIENCPIDKPDQLSNLTIYPNPTQGKLIINPGIQEIQLNGIYSIDGRLVSSLFDSSFELDLSNLPQGIYLIGIEQNFRTTYHKIVKY